MRKTITSGVCALALAALAAGCSTDTANSNTANTNTTNTTATTTTTSTGTTATSTGGETRTAPDNSEVVRREEGGVVTETRTFRNNPRVERVEVTTRGGRRTARVYSRSGEARDLPEGKVETALEATGDALADGAGFVADKTVEGVKAAGEGAKNLGEKGAEGAKAVGDRAAEGAKTVGEKTVEGAKKAGAKTAEGAKKVGGAIKDAVKN